MKNIFIVVLFMINTLHQSNIVLSNKRQNQNLEIQDSTYFSLKSSYNLKLQIFNTKNAFLTINGKTKKGAIVKNKYSKDFFDFKENGIVVITFSYEDHNVIVENQKYQFKYEIAKFIVLEKINNDSATLNKIKNYIENNESILDENIALFNDKAYFLEKMNLDKTAAYILEKIIVKYPERVVAWLNIADLNFKLKKYEQAKKQYLQYITLMKMQKKDLKKIPKHVFDRVK